MKNFSIIIVTVVLIITGFGCTTFGGDESKPPPPPPPPPQQEGSTTGGAGQTATTEEGSGGVDIEKLPKKKGYPYGIKTNTPGLVKSPYAPDKALVDVSRFQSGNFVRCPHTGKIFVVP